MTRYSWRWCLLATVFPFLAPGGVLAQTALEIAEMRQGIAAQRRQAELTFSADEARCYQQFAVNDCLIQAKKRQSATLLELKHREVILNDEERKRKAAIQVRKQDERSSLAVEQRAATQGARKAESANLAEQRQNDRFLPAKKTTNKDVDVLQRREPNARVKEPVSKSAPSSLEKSQRAAVAQERFARKKQEAENRKAALDRARGERVQTPSAPLPPNGAPATPLAVPLAAPAPNGVKP